MVAHASPEDRALGLFTRADAVDLGLSGDGLAHRVRTGKLTRPQRGVYLDGHGQLTPKVRARAALLAAEPGAVVCGTTAARVWGWAPVFDGPEELAIGMADGHRVARPTLRWTRWDVPEGAIDRRHGFPLTAPAWTLAHVLQRASERDAVWIADQALRVDPTLRSEVAALLIGRQSGRSRRRLEMADSRSESPLETLVRILLTRHGYEVVTQHVVRDEAGRAVARADLALPEWRIAIEGDGSGPHSDPEALFRDRRRQNLLIGLGWIVLRFTWRDLISNERRVLAEVGAAVERARSASDGVVSRKVGL
jgi:very-short-patch-repair endonuclease